MPSRTARLAAAAFLSVSLVVGGCGGDSTAPSPRATRWEIVDGAGQTAAVGLAVTSAPSVRIFDQNAQPFRGATVVFSVVSGAGVLRDSSVTTGSDGLARLGEWRLGQVAGRNEVRARTSGLSDLSFVATGTPGTAVRLTLPAALPATDVGATLAPFVVQVVDQFNNAVPGSGRPVTVAPASAGITLAGTTATTDSSGAARFPALVLRGVAGAVTLRFSSGTLQTLEAPITLRPGPVSTVTSAAFTTFASGVAVAPAPAAQLVDASGNAVARAGVSVTVTTANAAYTVANGTATTDAAGVATFAALSVAGPVGSFSLSVTPAGGTALARTASMSAGPSLGVALRGASPVRGVSGVALSPAPVLQLVDAQGNDATSPSRAVQVTVASSTGGPATLSRDTVRTDAQGRATFDNLLITAPAGTVTLRFAVLGGDPTGVTTSPITLTGPSARVVVRSPSPTSGTSGVPLSPAPVLQLVDAGGNETVAPTRAVRVTVASSTGGLATLSRDTVRTDALGRATFDNLSIIAPAGTVTLRFVAVGADTTSATLPITLSGATTPLIALDSTQVSFSATAFLAAPPARTVQVTNAGVGTLTGLAATVGAGASWLSATLSATAAPATLTLTPNLAGLAAGTYTTTVTLTAPSAPSVSLPVSMTVTAPTLGTVRYGTVTQNVYELDPGATVQPPTTVLTNTGADASAIPRTYTSRAPSVATVDATGQITAVREGQTFVVLTLAGFPSADSALVNVTKSATQPVLRAAVLRYNLASPSTVTYALSLDLRGRTLSAANLSVTWPFDGFTGFLTFGSFTPNAALSSVLTVNSTLAVSSGVLRLGIATGSPLSGVVSLGTLTLNVPSGRLGAFGRLSLLGTDLLDGALADFTTSTSLLTYFLVVR